MQQSSFLDIFAYCAGLGLFGVVLGFYAGGSATPVVAVVLPLLFGVIGGASGLYIAQVDFKSRNDLQKLRLMGLAFALFGGGVLFGTLWGASIRNQTSISKTLWGNPLAKHPSPVDQASTASEALGLLLLRARAQSLGITALEERNLIKKAQVEISQKKFGLPDSEISQIVELVEALASQLKLDIQSGNTSADLPVESIIWETSLLGSMPASEAEFPRHGQRLYLNELVRTLRLVVNDPSIAKLTKEQRLLLIQLYNKANEALQWLSTMNWAAEGALIKSVNEFVALRNKIANNRGDAPSHILVENPPGPISPGQM